MIKNNRPTKVTLVNFPQNIPFCSCLGSIWHFLKHFILMGHNSEKKVALVYFPKKTLLWQMGNLGPVLPKIMQSYIIIYYKDFF